MGGFLGPTFDAESKSAKIPNSLYGGGGGGGGGSGVQLQLLMLSPNLLKSQIPYMVGGGEGVGLNFQLLMTSPNRLKSKNVIGGGFAEIFLTKSISRQGVHLDYYILVY